MVELFSLPFFARAAAALLATGIAFPALGTFILHLELIPARFAVMHASLLGAAAALVFGLNPAPAAMAAAVLAGAAIAVISWRGKVSAGGSLGLIMTLAMGLAFIIFYKGKIHAIEAFNLFWGNVLALTPGDLRLTLAGSGAMVAFIALAYKEIQIVLYDRELAWATGVSARAVYGGIMLLVCVGIAVATRITGALMVDAATILPALAARAAARSFRGLLAWGAFFGVVMNAAGFALAFLLDLPVSPAIIVVGAVVVALARTAPHLRARVLSRRTGR